MLQKIGLELSAKLPIIIGLLFFLPCLAIGQSTGAPHFIKAEVQGKLQFREGRGYFISVPSDKFPEETTEVWLSIAEDKILVRRLGGMIGKIVIVHGMLEQLPENGTASTPPRGIFIRDFEIKLSGSSYPTGWFAPVNDPNKPQWEILPQEAGPGQVILSKRNELGLLSNFAATPFIFRGKRYASLEGFWQMMLYPEGPDDPRARAKNINWEYTRDQVAQMTAFEAKAAGALAEDNMKRMGIDWVTFESKRFSYRSSQPGEHYRLIVEATRAKVEQNKDVRRVLLATGDLILRPDHYGETGAPPEWKYYEILMQIRSELQKNR